MLNNQTQSIPERQFLDYMHAASVVDVFYNQKPMALQ